MQKVLVHLTVDGVIPEHLDLASMMSNMTFVGTDFSPKKPVQGEVRFNSVLNRLEIYDNTIWVEIQTVGNINEYRLETSEGTVLGKKYITIAPINAEDKWPGMLEWTVNTLGPTISIWEDTGARWYANNAKFWFRDEKDVTMFILRWS